MSIIASTFPSLFTWGELRHMDVRLVAYYVAEAEAVHRQEMARMAQCVGVAFSSKEDFKKFMDSLELTGPDSKEVDDTWGILKMVRKG